MKQCKPMAATKRGLARIQGDSALVESFIACVVVLILSLGSSFLLAWFWVLAFAVRTRSGSVSDTLLVCGHQLVDGRPSPDYIARLDRAAALATEHPELRLMLLGGGLPSEAAVGRDWLIADGRVGAERIALEEDSIDSFENLRHARELLNPTGSVHLLSSRYHLGRLRVFAGQLGLEVVLHPAEHRWVFSAANLSASLREAAFLAWFVSGRAWARLAGRRHLLERIR